MAAPAQPTQTWRFGVYEVDAHGEELRRAGIPIKLREQSFRILVFLLQHPGEIVTREDLRRVLWPADTFVDFEHSLNVAVMKLREALGDTADKPLYIETVPKRGYRFIAPVTEISAANNSVNNPWVAEAPPSAKRKPQTILRYSVIAAICVIVVASIGLLRFFREHRATVSQARSGPVSSTLPSTLIMQGPGHALDPVLSPDEKWIAYVWNGQERNHYDVYVQLLGSGHPLRLTQNKSARLGPPAWSPDGTEIAFTQCDGKNDGVFAVPSMGGAERRLTNGGCWPGNAAPDNFAWLSNGDETLTVDRCSATGPLGLSISSLSTGEKHCIAPSTDRIKPSGVRGFRLSPDGKSVAVRATTANACCNLYTVPLTGGGPRQLTFDLQLGCGDIFLMRCDNYMWTPESKSVVFFSYRTGLPWLWRVPADGGPIEPERTYPAIGSLSKDGRLFVYSGQTNVELPAIWRADLAAPGESVLSNRKIISVREDTDAQPSPDGTQLAWMSYRSGFYEIWTSRATGENPIQLTHLERYSGTPRWSPDGKWIAFDSSDLNFSLPQQIYAVEALGGNLHAITNTSCPNGVPSWSRDGKSIYSASCGEGHADVWKQSIETGKRLQLTHQGGFDPIESYDGRTVYYSRFDQAGIWSVPSDGGKESQVLADVPQQGYWGWWALAKTGIYFLDADAEPRPAVEFYDFATRRTSHVLTLDKQPSRWFPSLSATSDGKTIYYAQYERQSVIKMIEFPQ